MISRRGALVAIKIAVLGGVQWVIAERNGTGQASAAQTSATALDAKSGNVLDRNASEDLARLGAHVYSEEGIPMFLACENLAAVRPIPKRTPMSSDLNRKVASAFHRYAEEWQRIHPEARASDVAKIVELIAGRDFDDGGTETSL